MLLEKVGVAAVQTTALDQRVLAAETLCLTCF